MFRPWCTTWPKWRVCVAAVEGFCDALPAGAKQWSATARACRSGNPDHSQSTFAQRGGNRRYGVIEHVRL